MPGPKACRRIGMAVMFIGFILFYRGFHFPTADDPVNGLSWPLIVLSLAIVTFSMAWIVKTVRCPHCGHLLGPKGDISVCRFCGRRTE